MPADWPLGGTCPFPGSPVPLMTLAPVVDSRWGGTVVGGALPAVAALPMSLALQLKFRLLYWNQILLSRVCFLILLIIVYKT